MAGVLLPIGGAESKVRPAAVLDRFVELADGVRGGGGAIRSRA